MPFSALFSEWIVLSDELHRSQFGCQMGHNLREIAVIVKSPKIGGKVCAHHFV